MITARYGGRLPALRTGRFYPQEYSWYSFSLRAESTPGAMVWSEGNMSLKNPVTTLGMDPGTVRLVVLRLNHYATPGPGRNRKHYYLKASFNNKSTVMSVSVDYLGSVT